MDSELLEWKRRSAERELVKANRAIVMMERIDQFRSEVCSRYGISLYADYGSKYCKITISSSVFCFIDLSNGDILKAASLYRPAKHARGNVFANDLGCSAVTEYGAVSLR